MPWRVAIPGRAFAPVIVFIPRSGDGCKPGEYDAEWLPRQCPACCQLAIIGHGRRRRQAHDGWLGGRCIRWWFRKQFLQIFGWKMPVTYRDSCLSIRISNLLISCGANFEYSVNSSNRGSWNWIRSRIHVAGIGWLTHDSNPACTSSGL